MFIHHHYLHHHRRGWAKASSCCFHICLSCAILCQIVAFQWSSSSSLHRLARLPLDRSLRRVSRWCTQSPSVISYSAQVHFLYLTFILPIYIYLIILTHVQRMDGLSNMFMLFTCCCCFTYLLSKIYNTVSPSLNCRTSLFFAPC